MKESPAIVSHVVGRYYPGDFHKPVAEDCADCGKLTEVLELFPGGRCLECHAAAPEVRAELAAMTAEKLAAMWGGPPA